MAEEKRDKPARVGVDLGGTKIQAIVVGPGHEVLGEARVPTPAHGGPEAVADAVAAAVNGAAARAGIDGVLLAGVGLGFPGAVDAGAGVVGNASNLAGFGDAFPLGDALRSRLGVSVSLGNDVQVATEAEAAIGAGRSYRSLLGVFWGTGVGGGLILDRRSWLGRGTAGEFGHMVVRLDGARCTCGRRGCVEAYAGRASMEARARRGAGRGEVTRLFELMEERGKERLTSGVWARALKEGDELAERIVEAAVAAIGAGIASAQNLLDVEAVVVGGGLGVRLGEPYLERIGAAMTPHLFVDTDPPALRLAELGDLGGALGAALLVDA